MQEWKRRADLLRDLVDDGDTVEADGMLLRLRVQPDDFASVSDCDNYGRFQWHRGDTRPHGFDGAAEVVDRDSFSGRLWWQPPADMRRGGPGWAAFRSHVLDVWRYGFVGLTLEQLHGVDAYGRPIVVACASIGAVEPFTGGEDLTCLLVDLFDELTQQAAVA